MNEEKVKALADALLSENPSYLEVENVADTICSIIAKQEPESIIDKQHIIALITTNRKIYQPVSSVMQSDDEGANWLPEFRATGNCSFRLWNDYKKSLTLPTSAVLEINRSTDFILNKLANPAMNGNWYRAGLVVGHVQSGKTGNFVGLANKAMDCGYKIILVLTGMYNDLRSQTQGRLDKGSIGCR